MVICVSESHREHCVSQYCLTRSYPIEPHSSIQTSQSIFAHSLCCLAILLTICHASYLKPGRYPGIPEHCTTPLAYCITHDYSVKGTNYI